MKSLTERVAARIWATPMTWEKRRELDQEYQQELSLERAQARAKAQWDLLTPEQQQEARNQRKKQEIENAERSRLERAERLREEQLVWEKEEAELLALGRQFSKDGWKHQETQGYHLFSYQEPFQIPDPHRGTDVTWSYRIRVRYQEDVTPKTSTMGGGEVGLEVEVLDQHGVPREQILSYQTVPAPDKARETVRRFMMAGLNAIERDIQKRQPRTASHRVLARYQTGG